MDQEPLRRVIRSLGVSAEPGGAVGLSDAQLLKRFAAQRDEAAFELLLWRHGPMVLGVCRRLVPDAHAAEDAFQATFLALVRRADSICEGAAVGSWLYRVAYRVSLRLRAELAKRAGRERPDVELLAVAPGEEPGGDEFRRVLDEEVSRLPERWRAAFVLCCLEGKTGAEAARELRCPPGTVSSRLTRARDRLRRRLARRGLAPVTGALAAALAGEAPAVPLPAPLVAATLKASLRFSTGQTAGGGLSAQAVTLAEGVLRAMSVTKARLLALLLLLLGALATGGALTCYALTAAPPGGPGEVLPPEQAGETKPGKKTEGPTVVRVMKPVPGGLARTATQPCTVEASDREELFAVVPGTVKGQSVDIGSFVKRGQVLAEIDAPLLALDEEQAAAAVQQAKNLIREAEARVAVAKTEVQAAASAVLQRQAEVTGARATEAFRKRQHDRLKGLLNTKSVDVRIVDEQEAHLEAARAQLSAARALVESAKADLALKRSKVAQAEAAVATTKTGAERARIALEKARHARSLTRVVSPVDGVVTRRNYQNGHYVRPGEPGGQLPLITVERIDRVRVVVDVPERDVPLTEPGVPVELAIEALPGVRFKGCKVTRVGFTVDPKSRTMRVEVDVPNPKRLLRPGMYGNATLQFQKGSTKALRVPVSCLVPLPGGKQAVYVARAGKAYRTPVQVGQKTGQEAEILSGLGPDDLVVTDPRNLSGEVIPVEVKGRPSEGGQH
jgi:HlyD family secretion protein